MTKGKYVLKKLLCFETVGCGKKWCSQFVKPLFTIYIIIKVDGLERKLFDKTGIFPFAFIKANTRKDENDYI